MADCGNCKSKTVPPENVSYFFHQEVMARAERNIKRWMIAFFITFFALLATNVGWIVYESQFETVSYTQDGEGINNVNVGEQGDINNGSNGQV